METMTEPTLEKPVKKKETPGEIFRSFLFMVLLFLAFGPISHGKMNPKHHQQDCAINLDRNYPMKSYTFPTNKTSYFVANQWTVFLQRAEYKFFLVCLLFIQNSNMARRGSFCQVRTESELWLKICTST